MKLKWLRTAIRDLDSELNYISQNNPTAARQILARILHALELLKSNPAIGRAGRVNGTRELIISNTRYIIPYRVRSNTIEVLRLFHTARQIPRNWR